jgi:transcriptional regulator with XRE-family HTH domain
MLSALDPTIMGARRRIKQTMIQAQQQLGKTKAEIAALVGVLPPTYYVWERKGRIPAKYIPRLAKILKVEEENLGLPPELNTLKPRSYEYSYNILPLLRAVVRIRRKEFTMNQLSFLCEMERLLQSRSAGKAKITPALVEQLVKTGALAS